jgi:non-heme chloroperoxidase
MPWSSRCLCALALVALVACSRDKGRGEAPAAAAAAPWVDPSPHRVSLVTIRPGVRLEVLDWGGQGTALVFLAGLQDVAHGFDAFAPQFTDRFHVLAITRRGYGASSQPAGGYDLRTRVRDLGDVLDSLRLSRVSLVGHSISGDELTGFAATYPDRVVSLVYLDAAYDHSGIDTLLRDAPAFAPGAADSASPAALQAFFQRVYGPRIPEAQVRATEVFAATGKLLRNVTPDSIDALVIRGSGHPDYARVRAPALAFYAVTDSAPQIFPLWPSLGDATRARARAFTTRLQTWAARERERFRRGVARGQSVLLRGANHYVFFSNEAEVVREMRAFLCPVGSNRRC